MSNNKSNQIEPKFNEFQAYEELRLIFVIAIETQNFDNVPAQITAWEKKYPLAEFTNPEIIRKIKALLDRNYLSELTGRYLADQILHIKEKQLEVFHSIQSIISSAEKTKDYATALREVKRWKLNLKNEGLALYDFSPNCKRKICALLLIPGKELKNQDDAIRDLKLLKDRGASLDSKDYSKEIDDWQNKYCIKKFPDKLQNELNTITAVVFQSISIKKSEETALAELESYIASPKTSTPIDDMASILSKYDYGTFSSETKNKINMLSIQALSIQEIVLEDVQSNYNILAQNSTTAVEFRALNDLKNIFMQNSHDSDALLNWIYDNRKINFSEFSRNQIIQQFTSVGYKVPNQASYYIPEINIDITTMSNVEFDMLRKDVILNYLGILSKGNSLSKSGKENITAIHATSAITEDVKDKNISIVLPVFDNTPEISSKKAKTCDESEIIGENTDSEDICNIIIEDIISDPLTTYSISNIPSKNQKSDLIVAPSSDPEIVSSNSATTLESSKPEEPKNIVFENTPIISPEQIPESSTINLVTTNQCEHTETYSNDITINSTSNVEQTATTLQEATPYSLTAQDQHNLEKVNELSTYILITAPILEMVHSRKEPLIHEKGNEEEYTPQKK